MHLLEIVKEGKVWKVVVIREGFSKNSFWRFGQRLQRYYTREAIESILPLLEGAPVTAYYYGQDWFDHVPSALDQNRLTKNVVGVLKNPEFREEDGKAFAVAELHIFESAGWLKSLLKEVWEAGEKDFLGLSIDGEGEEEVSIIEGRPCLAVRRITGLNEVTVVRKPAAGGAFVRLVASEKEVDSMGIYELMLTFLQAVKEALEPDVIKNLEEGLSPEMGEDEAMTWWEKFIEALKKTESDAGIKAVVQAAIDLIKSGKADEARGVLEKLLVNLTKYPYPYPKPKVSEESQVEKKEEAKTSEPSTSPVSEELQKVLNEAKELAESLKEEKRKLEIEKLLKNSNLPSVVQESLKEEFFEMRVSPELAKKRIKKEQEMLSRLKESGVFDLTSAKVSIEVETDEYEKLLAAMQGLLRGEPVEVKGQKIKPFTSLKESYLVVNRLRGGSDYEIARKLLQESAFAFPGAPGWDLKEWHQFLRAKNAGLREAVTTDWADLFGNAMYREILRWYETPSLQLWRKVVSNINNVKDFRENSRTRLGGFGSLPTVNEGADYSALTGGPENDEKVAYKVAKKGGLYFITEEVMVNDDVGFVRRLPKILGVAAGETLMEFVFNTLIADNPTMDYDSKQLFHADHGNLGTDALSADALKAARKAMRKQTRPGSNKRLGIEPRILLVPVDLEETAWKLISSDVSVTTAETATTPNFFKGRLDMIVVWFWDDEDDWYLVADPKMYDTIEIGFLGGKEEPEIFVQDQPSIGSVFSADKVYYKIRHIYGGDVLDHRTFYGSIVAGT